MRNMVKKLVVLSPEDIDHVLMVAAQVSDPRAVNPNFSKGLREIIRRDRSKGFADRDKARDYLLKKADLEIGRK